MHSVSLIPFFVNLVHVLGVTLPEDTIKLWPLYGQTMLQSSFPCGIILQERKSERKSKRVRDQEPSHFKFQLAQNILSERTRQKQENPTHPKYGCRNSFLNLLLSPRNPSLCTFLTFSCIPLELIPFTAQHTLLPWFFFPHRTNPRDRKILWTTETHLAMQVQLW